MMMQQQRFPPPNQIDGGYRPQFNRYPGPGHTRFRPPGFAGQINDGRQPRPWVDHRPGYTPSTFGGSGRQTKKTAHRKTIDYNAIALKSLQNRLFSKDGCSEPSAILPDPLYMNDLALPTDMIYNPINCVTTKFVRQSTNKIRCPIFCVAWTPEGRRLITGASSGEFTLWNGLTFNFETILQAHDSSVRSMIWSHDDTWMMTADHNGFVKYWQSNMNNVKMFQAHKDPIRGLSFCPTDNKFASCSDDGTVRVFDFANCVEERTLKGHGADVKCVDWHPQKSIIVSGSKDSQQPIKLWDARTGSSLATIHAHKNTVMSMKWNNNGNWFLTASRDHLLKLFDIRNMKSEFQTFKGHQKEATVVSWHPIYEEFFASGGSDGAVKFWSVGTDKEVGTNDTAHEGFIWSMAWHPLGHILVTGSNDHSTKFWARNKPGDSMKDRYNLNLLPTEGEEEEMTSSGLEVESMAQLPGMGIDEEQAEQLRQANTKDGIPGLDMDHPERKGKYTYIKKIDKSFAAAWEGRAPPPVRQQMMPNDQNEDRDTPQQPPQQHQPPGQPLGGLLGNQPMPNFSNGFSSGGLLGDGPPNGDSMPNMGNSNNNWNQPNWRPDHPPQHRHQGPPNNNFGPNNWGQNRHSRPGNFNRPPQGQFNNGPQRGNWNGPNNKWNGPRGGGNSGRNQNFNRSGPY